MEWVFLVTLFSSPDEVLLRQQPSYRECIQAVKRFEKEHKRDKDIKEVKCSQGIVLESDHDSFFAEFEQ